MPKHSLKLCWLHLVWGTKDRFPFFQKNEKASACLDIIKNICRDNSIYFKVGFVNPEHVHLLVDLPVEMSIKNMLQLLKGSSSHTINQKEIVNNKFSWARGYAAFSVSSSGIDDVCKYIINQKEHHKKKTFHEEWEEFIHRYNLLSYEKD